MCTAIEKFVALAEQLDKNAIPVFCDEGVFRLVLNIFLKKQSEFKCLIPVLGGFHMAKCVLHCIGKYLNGCELEDRLVEIGLILVCQKCRRSKTKKSKGGATHAPRLVISRDA